jgi:hypothetical protein
VSVTERKDGAGPVDPDARCEDLSREGLVGPVRTFAIIVHRFDTTAATFGFPRRRHATPHIPVPGPSS